MPHVTFRAADGATYEFDAELGETLRNVAVQNDVPGIDGDCGGNCACATCHVYVTEEWFPKVGAPEPEGMEESLIQFAEEARETSRLACQIPLTAELDGLVVEVPEGQH